MPKTITITISNQQYQSLVDLVDKSVPAPGMPSADTVEEYCAKAFVQFVLRPAIEQHPPAELKALRKAREAAQKAYEEATQPTITAAIT